MQASMLLKKKASAYVPAQPPFAGYNYDQNVSTGTVAVTATKSASQLVTPPQSVTGYSKVLNGKDTNMFADGKAHGVTDFTFSLRLMLGGGTSGYVILAQFPGSAQGTQLRIGDNGFGNRLQPCLNPNTIGTCWDDAFTRDDVASGWHLYTWQRRSNTVTFYVNGVQRNLANGTGTTYGYSSYTDASDLTGLTGMYIDPTAVTCYVAEWALWNTALYTGSFTPPTGYLV